MKTLIRYICCFVTILSSVSLAVSQELDPTFASVFVLRAGVVASTVEQPDGKLLVAGYMNRVNGQTVAGLLRLNADGTSDPTFNAGLSSAISQIRLLPNGQIIAVANGLIRIGNRNFNGIVKLNADGTLAEGFDVGAGAVGSIAAVQVQPDSKIVLGGNFTGFNGTATNGLVRLNANGSVDQQFVAALGSGLAGGAVNALLVQPDGKLVVGGDFRYATNPAQPNLFRLTSNGTLDTSFEAALPLDNFRESPSVTALALDPRTNYIVVRTFSTRDGIVRLTATGKPDPDFTRPVFSAGRTNNYDLVTVDAKGRILLSGDFDFSVGSNKRKYLARFLSTGELDNTFIPQQFDFSVRETHVLANGTLLVAGNFSRYGQTATTSLLKLNDQAQIITDFNPKIQMTGTILGFAQQPDGKLIAAGTFTEVNGVLVHNLVRLHLDGTLDVSFNTPRINGRIDKVIAQANGKIVVAGDFTEIDNQSAPYVAHLTSDGRMDPSFKSNLSASTVTIGSVAVQALAVEADGSVLLGGVAIGFGNQTRDIYRLLPTGAVDEQYLANTKDQVRGTVLSLALLPDGRHYVGGAFDPVNTNPPATAIIRLKADGTRDETFQSAGPDLNFTYARQIAVLPDNKVLIGGNFMSYKDVARAKLARLNPDGSVDKTFDATPNGYVAGDYVNDFAVQSDGRILVNTLNNLGRSNQSRGTLYRLLPDGALEKVFSDFASNASRVTSMLLQQDGRIVVSGAFTEVDGQPRAGIVRLSNDAVLPVADKQSVALLEAWPNPVTDQLRLQLDMGAMPQTISLVDVTGKSVFVSATPTAQMQIPVRHLTAGVYILRVAYANWPVTRRVLVQ
ncbi:T9SS type A sorting domain-containing protein [Hymenobacter sp. BT507]|uniref:T9SS type A sorting domain-containing protein n=1 Tax=Hymenobacter citatus TaxID=2763506 RepID=A0ABR7MI68_9BACT|nr:T9SS type A sorting domain-containing protein [Hymenobacter citatus]MBC6610302.1 T9SS type A sorting domain-containing protein [Hymenobacter citatus]